MKTYSNQNFTLRHFTSLSKKDQTAVLSWRNDPSIRMWMHNKEEISLSDHLHFIKQLKTDETKSYWLVERNGFAIGVVYLIHIDEKRPELGMYLSPEKIGMGHGTWILQHFLHFIFHELKLPIVRLEVYANNQAALHLYKKFGFVEKEVKDDLICMELESTYETSEHFSDYDRKS